MSALDLARLQFATTAGLHFVLVATTLGLAAILAWQQTSYAGLLARPGTRLGTRPGHGSRTGHPNQGEAAAEGDVATAAAATAAARDTVLRVYLVNYGAGIVTGIVLELQVGMNWHNVPADWYDPIATTLAVETLAAFFVESTLLGLFLASAGRFSERTRAVLLWAVAAAAALSAVLVVDARRPRPPRRWGTRYERRDGGDDRLPRPHRDRGAVALLALVAPVALLTVGALQLVWWRAMAGTVAAWFSWEPVSRGAASDR